MIPKPFAKAHWVYGDPIYVTPEDDVDATCLIVQEAMKQAEDQAEATVRAR